MENTIMTGGGQIIELGAARCIEGPEVEVMEAVYAYTQARYEAFTLAQQGDRRAYEERSARVDDLSRAMLSAIMRLGPRHPNDRGA